MKTQTIGVEIEFTGITRKQAAETVATYLGTTARYTGDGYKTYEVKGSDGRTWKLMRDGSIEPQRKENGQITWAGDDYKVEFVTPILKYDDIETLQEIVRALRKAGGFVNPSCGMHVHIGAAGFTPAKVRNLINAVASKEDLMYKALNTYESRKDYCKPTDQRFLRELNEKKPETMSELAAIWYNTSESRAQLRAQGHYDFTRYTVCNLHALFSKGTIEFRLYNATLHAGEVKTAIQLSLALTHQAKTATKAIYRKTETDNPKYTFRCWLLRLGMNGEEFRTARHHLLKHLEGDTAWRDAGTRTATA